MRITVLMVFLCLSGLTACSNTPPKANGWNDIDNEKEVPVNQNLTQLQNQINNKNVWSN